MPGFKRSDNIKLVKNGRPGYQEIDLDPTDPYKYVLIDYDGEELGKLPNTLKMRHRAKMNNLIFLDRPSTV